MNKLILSSLLPMLLAGLFAGSALGFTPTPTSPTSPSSPTSAAMCRRQIRQSNQYRSSSLIQVNRLKQLSQLSQLNQLRVTPTSTKLSAETTSSEVESGKAGEEDPNEIIGRRIIVTGDVAGGYYRSCVKNEAGRFRKLIGTMSPPDDSRRAEIYVEGKRKMVDGFIRWCQRGNVGLSQSITVESVVDEFPTGLYDDFYVQTGR